MEKSNKSGGRIAVRWVKAHWPRNAGTPRGLLHYSTALAYFFMSLAASLAFFRHFLGLVRRIFGNLLGFVRSALCDVLNLFSGLFNLLARLLYRLIYGLAGLLCRTFLLLAG